MNSNPKPPLGKRARMRIERPREILRAALNEFFSKGFAAARVEDIATEVGVTKGTVYFYFESKEELFAQVVRTFSPSPEEMSATLDDTSQAWPQLDAYLSKLFALIAEESGSQKIFHLLMSEGRHFPTLLDEYFDEFLAPSIEYVRTLLEYGAAKEEFHPGALPMAELLFAPAMLANIWMTVFQGRKVLNTDRLADEYKRILRLSLGA